MSQMKTPLFSGLVEHARKNPIQFHIPGHKKGMGMHPAFREFIGENALSIDLINIAPLDDLHHPKAMIKEAQELAAEAFGADHTFFSVQGTSGAIMAMIMATCKPGDKIIVPRNVHKSVMSAVIFAGAVPVFIHPAMDERLGISHGITVKAVQKALQTHPDAAALLVINPTYYGIAGDLREIVRIAHQYGIPVLVDEAHGVHIHFHEDLPISAMQAGADMAATSVHKLGGSLTQTSILNVREGLVDIDRVKTVMSMLTTTSTSYILLASLDMARQHLVLNGRAMMDEAIRLADKARKMINEIPRIYCIGREILGKPATYAMDPTKLLIHVRDLGITGWEVENWLRDKYNIEVELSDLYNVLCLITPGDTDETIEVLVNALRELAVEFAHVQAEEKPAIVLPRIPVLSMTPRDAFYAETEVIPLAEAEGRVITEFIMVYPPGIPIFLPGEVITADNIAYIQENIRVGLPVQGPEDETLRTVKVVKQQAAISG
ncbi:MULTISPECIES: aminotransferase class I/II-fold pyridoxal phosphate-dependent enzyme [Bacillales]|jgi:arginine/lysine/ornithine decarboxylase|uniref:aminotransferase class I/II-fold pyridoxal phosphate-dependent enzyme n=1 Tax=Brevibacillus TaxID=55080 RepID=UPI000E382A71|nr:MULTISPECIES: aminotransferase class I/II-fold pyridoxal phosphate-dependent enzyme [Bacillales]REK61767.1 MAG: arginine decarboxylase [Brevibacillus sp.]MBR8658066.1 aminotransferase class I/II-fold pyridoxal phosphate-dependent enzyme [Brevibacillus sp. NL20B1]MDT3414901.1 lysine decarboxylase [Brevibacillus aydinogluensis]NNV01592.1 aminotransferase class I/II-fold pyridoxal phosphate-dependent enzyme [Brevibacillus sp. MCWH]UFJ61241.1 aminotransferase class I/II-fold pyridoxal phosphate